MISLPVHRKFNSADENEWFEDLMTEYNEMFMARRDYLRKGVKKGEPTNATPEGQHLRKEIADVFLVTFGYLMFHSSDREDAENFILQVILDNKNRGKYSPETEKEILGEVLNHKELIPKLKAILDELR